MTFRKLSLVFNQLHSLQFTTVCDVPSVDSCITGKKKKKEKKKKRQCFPDCFPQQMLGIDDSTEQCAGNRRDFNLSFRCYLLFRCLWRQNIKCEPSNFHHSFISIWYFHHAAQSFARVKDCLENVITIDRKFKKYSTHMRQMTHH